MSAIEQARAQRAALASVLVQSDVRIMILDAAVALGDEEHAVAALAAVARSVPPETTALLTIKQRALEVLAQQRPEFFGVVDLASGQLGVGEPGHSWLLGQTEKEPRIHARHAYRLEAASVLGERFSTRIIIRGGLKAIPVPVLEGAGRIIRDAGAHWRAQEPLEKAAALAAATIKKG